MKDIAENNKLIAEFMGCELKSYPTAIKSPFHGRDIWWSPTSSDGKTRTFWCEVGKEHYHDSWDWLMPVVEKIYSNDEMYLKNLEETSTQFYTGGVKLGTRLNRVYEQVIDYIKWYNKQIK